MELIKSLNVNTQAALISAIVSLVAIIVGSPIRYYIDKKALRYKLETEYIYHQKRKIKELIGYYNGELIEAGERLHNTLLKVYKHDSKGWLKRRYKVAGGWVDDKPQPNYFLDTAVYNFLYVLSMIRLFEKKAIFLDSRVSEKNDLEFLKYTKAIFSSITNVDLFNGMDYDETYAKDHFFSNGLRDICDDFIIEERLLTIKEFNRLNTQDERKFKLVYDYFDGLKCNEDRLRWDRLICFHVVLICYLNAFGYRKTKTSNATIVQDVLVNINNKEVIINLGNIFKDIDMGKFADIKAIIKCYSSAFRDEVAVGKTV